MAINLDASRAASTAPLRIDRQEADSRQHRWMFEMEKAMFASGAKPDPASGSADALPSAAPAEASAHTLAPSVMQRDTGASRLPALHAGAQSADDANRTAPLDGHSDSAANGTATQTAATPSAANVSPASAPAAPAPKAAAKLIGDHSAATPLAAHATPATLASAAALTLHNVGAAPLALAEGANPVLVQAPAVVTPLVAARAAMALAAFAGAAPADEGSAAEAAAAPALAAELGEAPTFEERLLHVYLANDGVHAYIRDANLEGGHLQAVAQALASEMAASGQQLAALTVNGKAVTARMAQPGGNDDLFSLPGDGHDAAPPSFYPSTPVRKGNT
jgi:hypothetical protein